MSFEEIVDERVTDKYQSQQLTLSTLCSDELTIQPMPKSDPDVAPAC